LAVSSARCAVPCAWAGPGLPATPALRGGPVSSRGTPLTPTASLGWSAAAKPLPSRYLWRSRRLPLGAGLVDGRRQSARGGMAPDGVVLLKPGCHGGTCLGAGAEVVVRQQLELQRGVERLRDRVVQRRTGAPHRLAYPGPGTGGGEQISGVLGGFNCSSQHLEWGGVHGQAGGVDEGVDGQVADEVAGQAVAAAGCGA